MRGFLFLVVLAVAAGCAVEKASVVPADAAGAVSAAAPKGEVREYKVLGMGCPGCAGGLCKLVDKIDGVAKSDASWEENRLTVEFESGHTPDDEKIADAIRRANFTPAGRTE